MENTNDPGKDGIVPLSGTNPNIWFAKDLTAFSLEYFNNDYTAINGATPIASVDASSVPATYSSELFNGNIRYMQTRLTNPTTLAEMPMLNAYKYDQLNRLKESRSYESGLSGSVWNPTTYGNSYYNAFTYDAMGNILTQVRHNRAGTKIEDMKYKYQYLDPTTKTKLQRNRLYHIYEPLSLSSLDATDIDNMGTYDSTAVNINVTNNYSYDEEGRLVKDKAEKISKIVWRVDGKVKEIQRLTGTTKWLKFDYDAMGHRIAKHVYNNTGTTLERSTYYILDAQGNTISTYDHEVVGGTAQFNLKERNIYGSSRIGSKQDSMNVLTATITQNYTQVLGTKYYEFSNHLGNVLTVFSDVKIALDENSDGIVDGFRVPIRNTADYSPFGVQLDGRTIQGDFYRRGFNGMEKDDEVKGSGNSYTTEFRQYGPRLGRWLSLDPLMAKYPDMSPYNAYGNNPILNIDTDGDSIARFSSRTGNFIKFVDDGKSTWTYQRGYYGENSKWKTVGHGVFNDPDVDIQAIKNKKITRIEVLSEAKIEKQIIRSGVRSKTAQTSPMTYAKEQGAKKMDYGVQGIINGDLNPNTFYVRVKELNGKSTGIAYNVGDIGNYMWGYGMAELGILASTAQAGAHYNNMFNGRSQKTSYYDFGPGTYGSPGLFDAWSDQKAISNGYDSNPKGRATMNEFYRTWPTSIR